MSIRKSSKDHLRAQSGSLSLLPPPSDTLIRPQLSDPLMFWTYHERETAPTDLNILATGTGDESLRGVRDANGKLSASFSGRPELILQLAPAISDACYKKAPGTARSAVYAAKAWWRIFDQIEKETEEAGRPVKRVTSVADFSEIHRERAYQSLSNNHFSLFLRCVNTTRLALGMRELHWPGPRNPDSKRHLPDEAHSAPVRHELKHGWLKAVRRWERAGEMLSESDESFERAQSSRPEADRAEQARLRRNYQLFYRVVQETRNCIPTRDALQGPMTGWAWDKSGYNTIDMAAGFYPTGWDIRMAFFHCAASTGWNHQVLLDLDATKEFIEIVPSPEAAPGEKPEPARYLMTGWKDRAGHEVYYDGLVKSQASAGMVLQALIKRTAPLREQLRRDLERAETEYVGLNKRGAQESALVAKQKEILTLGRGIRSPWLFVHKANIAWLTGKTTNAVSVGKTFLKAVIDGLNSRRAASDPIPYFPPEQFRDIFATYVYKVSGGSVLHVQAALGHKKLTSTQIYIDNNIIKEQSERNWAKFLQHFWAGIADGMVDPTLLAKLCRDGTVTEDEKQRLIDYRGLRRSRINVGCKDPTAPPKHVDPNFIVDGESTCSTHACALCPENAVLLPDSWTGLSKRVAELGHIKTQMSLPAFSTSRYARELENTQLALTLYDPAQVHERIAFWERQIVEGKHQIPEARFA